MKTCIKNPFPLPALIAGLGLILTGRAASQTFTTLHNLSYDDGFSPQAGLIASGNTLYGAAESGGNGGNGTLFAVSTTGASFTTLHVFTATDVNGNNSDGSGPDATLILAGNKLYGTAFDGGTNGNGTVYSYTIGASFTNLYNFSAGNTDASNNYTNSSGANPEVGLVISGNTLYGATLSGGSFGNGALFKVNTDGTGFMNLHSFTNSSDGAVPGGKLVLSGSILYGTTLLGGNGGGGTVFLLNTNGTGFRTLHSFTATDFMPPNGGPQPPPGYTNSDGVAPSSLILIGNTLYGTAVWGGTNGNGTVFSLTTNGTFTTLHSFAASAGANYTNSEGTHPINFDGLVLSGDTLYGTAYWGGSGGNGTIFSIHTNGTGFTSLHGFTAMDVNGNNSDGANPYASLALSQNTLYGTATSGGTNGDGYGTVFSISLVQPAGAASFTFTGSMTTNRENHTATLLPNGKVLVEGGITNADTGGADLSSAELFDSGSGKWTAMGVMTYERYLHTATLLPDGKVLVAGGAGATGALSSVELYDPSTGNWTLTNSMNAARIAHSATLLPNGKLLIAGGTLDGTTDISSAELYDPATGAWIMTGSMTTNRANHTATLLPNGKVLVVGGASGHHGANAIPGAELYDPLTGVWIPTGAPNTARGSYHTATLLSNGKVLVVAGSVGNSSSTYTASAEIYDPTAATWTYTGSLTTGPRHGHTATLLPNGTVLMAGGEGGTNDDVLSSAELYDPATGVWTATGYLNTAREWHTATLLPNGQVLMAGGCGPGVGSPAIATAELYNFVLGSPQVTTTSLPNGTAGSPYSQQLSAVSGELPYSWSLISGSLPSGLTLATNGVISGTPTSNGTNNFTVQVTDAANSTATQALSLTISAPLPPVLVAISGDQSNVIVAFVAPTGEVYTLQATADLTSPVWSSLGSGVTIGSVIEFVDSTATGPSRFYRVAVGAGGPAPVYSLNVVGYVNRLMQPGTNLVENPFTNWDNTIGSLLPNCPDGTLIYDNYGVSSEWSGGGWTVTNLSLNPGDGAILVNPSGPFLVTFAGEVMQGALTNPLPAQPMLKSSMAPVAGLWEFPVQEGDQIQTWDVTNQTFVMHTFSDGAWTNTPPTVQPGEAFWVNVSAATNWVQNFTVVGGGPPIFSAPQLSGGKSNITFQLSGPAGSDYVLQVSTNLLNWSPVNTSTIPVSGSINLTNPISGTSRRFYRVYLQ